MVIDLVASGAWRVAICFRIGKGHGNFTLPQIRAPRLVIFTAGVGYINGDTLRIRTAGRRRSTGRGRRRRI